MAVRAASRELSIYSQTPTKKLHSIQILDLNAVPCPVEILACGEDKLWNN